MGEIEGGMEEGARQGGKGDGRTNLKTQRQQTYRLTDRRGEPCLRMA